MIRAWVELVYCLVWMIVSDTWIAKRMRDRANGAARAFMFDNDLTGDEKMIGQAVMALRVVVALACALVFGLGWAAHWIVAK